MQCEMSLSMEERGTRRGESVGGILMKVRGSIVCEACLRIQIAGSG